MKLAISIFINVIMFLVPAASHGQDDHKLNEYFQKKMEKANLAGLQAAYINEGKIKWDNSYGFRDFNKKEKVNDFALVGLVTNQASAVLN